MKKPYFVLIFLLISGMASAQNLTPELLLKIGRVSGKGISKDGKYVIFSVGVPNIAENKIESKTYRIAITGGRATAITNADELLAETKISTDGKYRINSKEVKEKKVGGKGF